MSILANVLLEKNNGKCYLYVEDNKALALIMGCVRPYDNYDYLDYKCPKTGIITELIVSKNLRSTGIGQKMIDRIEEYFNKGGVVVIEWADTIKDILPKERLDIKFKVLDENKRMLILKPYGAKYEELCEAVL